MAINIPIITEFADAGLKSAQGAFSTFRSKVAEAEGGMGKFKAGSQVAFDSVKANAGALALGAGAAIAGFAAKAIGDFQDLALGVDDFRNKTDLTLQQASEWVSYTGDLGIEADAITKIFSRVAKAATDEIPAFEELGVAIALGEDGSTDIEETFFRVNDAINSLEDPVAQAAYRADLFGKGWMSAAEIIQMSSDDIKENLAGVKDFEVIDEKEIEKAKDLRRAQDELGDAFAEVSVKVGTALIPALTAAVDLLTPLINLLGDMNIEVAKSAASDGAIVNYAKVWDNLNEGPFKFLTGGFGLTLIADQVNDVDDALDEQADTINQESLDAWKEYYGSLVDANTASDDLHDSLMTVDEALDELTGNIDERRTMRKLQDGIEDARDAAIKAFTEATPEAIRNSEAAIDDLRLDVADYIMDIEGVPVEWQTKFIAALDQASVDDIERILAGLARAREIPFMPRLPPGVGGISEIGSGGRPIGEAPIGFGIPSLSGVGFRSGVTVNVAGSVISQNDLVESVRKGLVNSQRNGAGLVYSNR